MYKLHYTLLFLLQCTALQMHAMELLTAQDVNDIAAEYYTDLQPTHNQMH